MTSRRRQSEAVVDVVFSKDLIMSIWCPFLQAAGFQTVTGNVSLGCLKFVSTNSKVVMDAFGCLPHAADTLSHINEVKTENLFKLTKSCNNLQTLPMAYDFPRSKVATIRSNAVHELMLTEEEVSGLTKPELIEKIVASRFQNKTYVGFEAIYQVLVDEEHPFSVSVRPGRFARALIRVKFSVSKQAVIFDNGPPRLEPVF
jgi:hypothetical protein